jgi:hypothetical protein
LADNQNPLLGIFGSGRISLKNNILESGNFSSYLNLGATANEPIISLGGNLVSDDDINEYLNSIDQSNTDPLFEVGTYELSANSPAIDAAILLDNPTDTDFAGNSRIQGGCLDIGAIESPYDAGTECLLTSTREVLDLSSSLLVYPNPVSAMANISLENEWQGEVNLRIVNALGQIVWIQEMEKTGQLLDVSIDMQQLPDGVYRLLLSNGASMVVKSLIKQRK